MLERNKSYILLVFISLTFCYPSFSQKSFTLREAVEYGLKNNGRLGIQKTEVQDVNEQIREYTSIGLPKISAKVGYTYFLDIPTNIFPNFIDPAVYEVLFKENILPRKDLEFGSGVPVQFGTKNNLSAGIELSTLLFDGSFFVGLRAQKMYRELAQLQYGQTEAEVKYQISKSYLSVLSLLESRKVIENNLQNIQKVLTELTEINKAGLIEKLDVERLQLSYQMLNTEKEKLERVESVAMNALKYIIGVPLSENITLSENLDQLLATNYASVMDPSISLQVENRPEHKSISKALVLTDLNVKRYKATYLPSLYGFASYQQSLQRNDLFDKNDNSWFPSSLVGLNLNIPIFDGFDRQAKISRAKLMREKTQLQKNELEKGIHLEYENAKIQYINALAHLESNKGNVNLAEKIFQTTQIKFKEGVGSSMEITQAERDMYTAQSQVLEAQISLIQAKLDLDKALGK